MNILKKFLKLVLTAVFAVSFLFPIFSPSPALACSGLPGQSHYTIEFNGRTLDDDISTWSYTIYKTGCGPRLSHWIWQPCFPLYELEQRFVSATPEPSAIGFDGSTLHHGIKWEIDGVCHWPESGLTFIITITGQPAVDEEGAIGVIKAGQAGDQNHGNQPHFDLVIPGPSCAGELPEPTYNISGMKFNDENDNGEKECFEIGLEGWTMTIEGPDDFSNSTTTDEQGHYSFPDLSPGSYTICEVQEDGWEQTYPTENEGCHLIEIESSDIGEVDFGNREISEPGPYCGDGNVDLCEECDQGENNGIECTPEYGSTCNYCSSNCQIIELTGPYCGDGYLDEVDEECDDGNTEDGDGCSAVCQIEEEEPEGIQPGDIVINEIMQNPCVASDFYGEWFELYNTTDRDIDLQACVIRDNDTDSHTISTSTVILAGDYAVLTRHGDPLLNGGLSPDYVYADFILANADDEVILECNQLEIDRVEYDGGPEFPNPTGASMILAHPSLDNNLGSNWCVSTSPFGDGDLGTPDAQNDSCQEIPLCLSSVAGTKFASSTEPLGLADWIIELRDEEKILIATTTTDGHGDYIFDELCSGTYIINEVQEEGWTQVEPNDPDAYNEDLGYYYLQLLDGSQQVTDLDFVNHLVCPEEICHNEIDDDCDGDVDCDDSDCTEDEACQIGPTPECEPGETQPCDSGQSGICSAGTQTCDEEGFWEECVPDNEPVSEICDNGLDDDCDGYVDGDDSDCQPSGDGGPLATVGGGGGGGGPTGLIIFNEKNQAVGSQTATVSWFTNKLATSRVIYDTVPHLSMTSPPNYGYTYSTPEDPTKLTFRTVTITGLSPSTTYYWRPISHTSPEIWGDELVLTTTGPSPEEVIKEVIEGVVEEEIIEEEVEEVREIVEAMPEEVVPLIKEEIEEVIEEEKPEEVVEAEEEAETGLSKLLAAIVNIFQIENFCWLSLIVVIILMILYLLSMIRKKGQEPRKIDWIFPLIIAILIVLYCYFCYSNCWLLLLAAIILIVVFFLLRKNKEEQEKLF